MPRSMAGRVAELDQLADPVVPIQELERAGPLERSDQPLERAPVVLIRPTTPGIVRPLEQVARPGVRRRPFAAEDPADVVVVRMAERDDVDRLRCRADLRERGGSDARLRAPFHRR